MADRNYDRHRRDALAAERLTWSPNVIDIYSYCGNSGIYELAPGGDIEEVLWYSDVTWNSTERLVVAFQVALRMRIIQSATVFQPSHIQTLQPRNSLTSMVSTKSMISTVVDSLLSTMATHPCLFLVGNNPGTFRAPEEYAYKLESEKVDIYSMGNVFYALLTDLWPFEKEVTKTLNVEFGLLLSSR